MDNNRTRRSGWALISYPADNPWCQQTRQAGYSSKQEGRRTYWHLFEEQITGENIKLKSVLRLSCGEAAMGPAQKM